MFYNIESLAIKKTFVDYSILTTILLFSVNISSVNTIIKKKKRSTLQLSQEAIQRHLIQFL